MLSPRPSTEGGFYDWANRVYSRCDRISGIYDPWHFDWRGWVRSVNVIEEYYQSPEGLSTLIAVMTKYCLWLSSYEGLFYIANERAGDRIVLSREIVEYKHRIDAEKICVN